MDMELEEVEEAPINWREMVPEDVGQVIDLIQRVEDVDNPPYRTTPSEVRTWLAEAEPWHGIVCHTDEGAIVGYGYLSLPSSDVPVCVCRGAVDPEFRNRGIGREIVQWEADSGATVLEAFSPDGSGRVTTLVAADQPEFEQHLSRFGFRWTQSKYELRRSLSADIPPIDVNSYYSIEPWDDQWEEQARKLYNELMETQPGFHRVSPGDWIDNREAFRPDWSFVALDRTGDRPKLVGLVMVAAYSEDWGALGWKEGYIDLLGVRDFPGSTEVSRGLLAATMLAQRGAGMDRTATGIGDASNGGALAFYEDLGFERSFQTRTYTLEIPPRPAS